jgi:mRNA-binding protein PUF3
MHSDGTSPLQLMMKDQYGNYVIRKFLHPLLPQSLIHSIEKLLAQLKGAEREAFVEDMKPQLLQLKKYNYGKQIAAIEKLIFTGPQSYMASSMIGPATQTMPIEINSSAPTPMLTNGQNSPQSSSLPSTNVSTIDDPSEINSKTIDMNEKACPEVIINGV